MEEKLVNILNEMAGYLNISQMKKLQEVLLKNFTNNEAAKTEIPNDEYMKLFLAAKKIEGCSEKTLKYYRSTIDGMLISLQKNVKHILTEDLRTYLTEYQIKNHSGRVTIDNIRRILSSFFSWLTNAR